MSLRSLRESTVMTTRTRASSTSTKRETPIAPESTSEETAPPSTRRRIVVGQAKSDDDSVVEMLDALPPLTNVAMVAKLLLDDETKAEKVMDCIMELDVSRNKDLLTEFKGTDVCANLVHLLNTTVSIHIRVKVCRLVIGFTYIDMDGDYFPKKFLFAGAPEAIVNAMKQFPGHAGLQELGCGALNNLADPLDENDRRTVLPTLFEAGCIEVVVAAMKSFPARSQLQEVLIVCLANLSRALPLAYVAKLIASLDLAIAAMEKHAEVEKIQEGGLSLILNFLSCGYKQDIMNKGGGAVAAVAERKYRGVNEDIHKKALQLLKRLYS